MKFNIDKDDLKVIPAYIAVCILWGSTYIAMRIGVADFPPFTLGGIRFISAGTLMLLFVVFKGLKFPNNKKEIKHLIITGLIMMTGSNGLVLWAEQWVESGSASLILATTPLCIAIVELFLTDRESVGLKGWLGLFIGFAGVALLVMSGSGTGSIDVLGGILLLASSFVWAAGSVYSKRIKPSGSIVTNIGLQMLSGGIGQISIGAFSGEFSRVHFSFNSAAAIIYLTIFGSIIGYSSYIYILQKWSAVKAGTYAYVNPLVAVLFGALILGETISSGVITSTFVILGGVLLVQLSKTSQKIIIKNPSIIDGEA